MVDINKFDDGGILNLCEAILEQAKQDYIEQRNLCNLTQAYIIAESDSRGLVGKILSYAAGDSKIMLKEIERWWYDEAVY